MSIGTNLGLAKPSCIINFHAISFTSSRRASLLTSSSRFNAHQTARQYPRKHILRVNSSLESPSSTPPLNPPSGGLPGKGWIAGLVISLLLPFLRNKWGPLFTFKSELDKDLEIMEETVEVLEKVAERVEKVAEEVEEELPEGKFKDVVTKIEQVAELVAETAHLTDNAIDKVQELEDEIVSYIEREKEKPI